MYQYFKRQLKTPTFRILWDPSSGMPGAVSWEIVLSSSRQTHTPQVHISRCQTPTTHTKHHK